MSFLFINQEYEIGETYNIQCRKLRITARGQYGRKNYMATDVASGRNYVLIRNDNPPIVEIPTNPQTVGV